MTGDRRTVHVRIEGDVHGVGYRAWTHGVATGLGLDGWVRNRFDGSVEAVFQGPTEKVGDMLARCERGPAAAGVTRVVVTDEGAGAFQGFVVRATA